MYQPQDGTSGARKPRGRTTGPKITATINETSPLEHWNPWLALATLASLGAPRASQVQAVQLVPELADTNLWTDSRLGNSTFLKTSETSLVPETLPSPMRRSLRPSAQIIPNLPSSPKCFGFLFTALKFNKVSSLKVFFNQRLSKLGHSDQKSLLNVTFNFNGIPYSR